MSKKQRVVMGALGALLIVAMTPDGGAMRKNRADIVKRLMQQNQNQTGPAAQTPASGPQNTNVPTPVQPRTQAGPTRTPGPRNTNVQTPVRPHVQFTAPTNNAQTTNTGSRVGGRDMKRMTVEEYVRAFHESSSGSNVRAILDVNFPERVDRGVDRGVDRLKERLSNVLVSVLSLFKLKERIGIDCVAAMLAARFSKAELDTILRSFEVSDVLGATSDRVVSFKALFRELSEKIDLVNDMGDVMITFLDHSFIPVVHKFVDSHISYNHIIDDLYSNEGNNEAMVENMDVLLDALTEMYRNNKHRVDSAQQHIDPEICAMFALYLIPSRFHPLALQCLRENNREADADFCNLLGDLLRQQFGDEDYILPSHLVTGQRAEPGQRMRRQGSQLIVETVEPDNEEEGNDEEEDIDITAFGGQF